METVYEDLTEPLKESDFETISGTADKAGGSTLSTDRGGGTEDAVDSGPPRGPRGGAAAGPADHDEWVEHQAPSPVTAAPLLSVDLFARRGDAPTPEPLDSARSTRTAADRAARAERALLKRQGAAEFIRQAIGAHVPWESDQAFRAALADGTVLCRLINYVSPGAVPRIVEEADEDGGGATAQGSLPRSSSGDTPSEVRRTFENVTNFIRAARAVTDDSFSARDLEDARDRPAVAQCVLGLRDYFRSIGKEPRVHASGAKNGSGLALSLTDVALGSVHRDGGSFSARRPPSARASPLGNTGGAAGSFRESLAGGTLRLPSLSPQGLSPAGSWPDARGQAAPEGALSTTPRSTREVLPYVTPQSARAGAAAPSASGTPPLPFSFTPAATAFVSKHGSSATAPEAADGLNHLMRSCTHMLKARMGVPITPLATPADGADAPDTEAGLGAGGPRVPGGAAPHGQTHPPPPAPELALDAVGPVLETVLANLTSEYEKRLLGKDQEFKLAQEAQDRLRRQVAQLQGDVTAWKQRAHEAAAGGGAASAAAAAGSSSLALRANVELAERLAVAEARARDLADAAAFAEARAKEAKGEAEERADEARREAEERAEGAEREVDLARAELERAQRQAARASELAAENRRLYNEVQDLKGSIRVFCRVRPAGVTGDGTRLAVEVSSDQDIGVVSQRTGRLQRYKFDRVFDQGARQDEVYAATQPLIRSVLDGYDVCIFAYGQTGSGKTHTMSGTASGPGGDGDSDAGEEGDWGPDTDERGRGRPPVDGGQGLGLYQRALGDLFGLRDERRHETTYEVRVQMLEIYNECIRDLLAEREGSGAAGAQGFAAGASDRPVLGQGLAVVHANRSGENVPDAAMLPVATWQDVLAALARGAANRATAATAMNDRSSRSHQILTVSVRGRALDGSGLTTSACLHLVDLAGSERVGRSGAAGAQLVEAQHINRSLSALGGVMAALAAKAPHVPFRDSKLTQVLAAALAGQAKAMMFVHVAPEEGSATETASTLQFGRAVTDITLGAAKKNVVAGPGGGGGGASSAAAAVDAEEAKKRVARLEAELTDARRRARGELEEERARAEAELEDARGREARAHRRAEELERELARLVEAGGAGHATRESPMTRGSGGLISAHVPERDGGGDGTSPPGPLRRGLPGSPPKRLPPSNAASPGTSPYASHYGQAPAPGSRLGGGGGKGTPPSGRAGTYGTPPHGRAGVYDSPSPSRSGAYGTPEARQLDPSSAALNRAAVSRLELSRLARSASEGSSRIPGSTPPLSLPRTGSSPGVGSRSSIPRPVSARLGGTASARGRPAEQPKVALRASLRGAAGREQPHWN